LPVDLFAPLVANRNSKKKNPPPAEPIVGFSNLVRELKLVQLYISGIIRWTSLKALGVRGVAAQQQMQ
jgi:hypothetical protein